MTYLSKNKIIVLIGMPGSGKSTYVEKYLRETTISTVVVSSDNKIEEIAKSRGQTYSEVYPTIDMKSIEADMLASVRVAIQNKQDVILDRTNLTRKARARWLSQFPYHYEKVAVVFKIDDELLFERLNRRARETGKKIPRRVIQDMLGYFTPPQEGEFDITLTIEQD